MGCRKEEDGESWEPSTLSLDWACLLPWLSCIASDPCPLWHHLSHTPFPFSVSRPWEKTWKAERGLIRTGLVGKALKQTHPWLSSATCQLPHNFPDNCLESKAGLGPPWGLGEDHSSSLQICIVGIQMAESKTKFIYTDSRVRVSVGIWTSP